MIAYLISSDGNGINSLNVRMNSVKDKIETSIKHKIINGIWNESLVSDSQYKIKYKDLVKPKLHQYI